MGDLKCFVHRSMRLVDPGLVVFRRPRSGVSPSARRTQVGFVTVYLCMCVFTIFEGAVLSCDWSSRVVSLDVRVRSLICVLRVVWFVPTSLLPGPSMVLMLKVLWFFMYACCVNGISFMDPA